MVSPTSDSRSDQGKSGRSIQWLWLLPMLAVPALWLGRFRSDSAIAEDTGSPLPVQTQVLKPVTQYRVERTYTGTIVARRSSDLGFEQTGTLVEVFVEDGDTVPQGTPLARLDTRNLAAQRQQLEAQRRQAQAQFQELEQGPRQEDMSAAAAAVEDLQAQLDLARLQQKRREELYLKGAISLEERDQAVFGANALESRLSQATSQLNELNTGTRVEQITAQDAQVEQIDAQLKNMDVSIAKSVIYAPFNGRVSARMVDEGAVVGPGQTVLRLVENQALEARIGIPSLVANRITPGTPQVLEVNDQTYTGTVTALLPEIDEASQTVTVVVALSADAQPVVGATARLNLQEKQNELGYWLPTKALVAGERGLWSAYVLGEAQAANEELYEVSRREVEVLYTDGDKAFVRGLLQTGEKVITGGAHRLVPGQLVQN